MNQADPYNLRRFTEAQDSNSTYQRAVSELRTGPKTSHWMWFVFPQIAGLGRSRMAQIYALSSLREAEAYLDHPVLGSRLIECTKIVAELEGSAEEIFGATDATKLRSSMTLFARAAPREPLFRKVLERCFAGVEDEATIARL